jgi:hypothetical protein
VRELIAEVLLRLSKAIAAVVVGLIVYAVAVAALGATPSVELSLLAWLSGAAFILVVQESPI